MLWRNIHLLLFCDMGNILSSEAANLPVVISLLAVVVVIACSLYQVQEQKKFRDDLLNTMKTNASSSKPQMVAGGEEKAEMESNQVYLKEQVRHYNIRNRA